MRGHTLCGAPAALSVLIRCFVIAPLMGLRPWIWTTAPFEALRTLAPLPRLIGASRETRRTGGGIAPKPARRLQQVSLLDSTYLVDSAEDVVGLVAFCRVASVKNAIDCLRVSGEQDVHHGHHRAVGHSERGAISTDVDRRGRHAVAANGEAVLRPHAGVVEGPVGDVDGQGSRQDLGIELLVFDDEPALEE